MNLCVANSQNSKLSSSWVSPKLVTLKQTTVEPRFYPRSHKQENEDKIGGTLKVGFFKVAFRGI